MYQQDGEFCRYQDKLRYSRFQTAVVIEGALVYMTWGSYQLGRVTGVLLALGGLALVVLLSWASQKDEADYKGHLKRIQRQERACPDYPFEGAEPWLVPRFVSGRILIPVGWAILYAFNVIIVIRQIVNHNF
jgi:hypothetical protein